MAGDAHAVARLASEARVVVCAGTGGVGKTSTAAALGVFAARRGRRVVVVTIDPAKRLADALGVEELGNEPVEVELDPAEAPGTAGTAGGAGGGSLHALMLDAHATFDALVTRYAKDPHQAHRILANRFYQNVAGSLSGTGEYMAMEKLHDLYESGRFDLIVVDTPPSHHALAFLDAPRLISRLLDHRLYRVLVTPTRGIARTATSAVHLLVRQLTRVVGADVVDDAVAFFRAFDGMERGFEQRANAMLDLLRSSETACVLVASPRTDTLDEARFFAGQLAATRIAVRAVVVNRVTPAFGADPVPADGSPAARALADFRALAAREQANIDRLRAALPDAPIVRVPLLAGDVHDLAGLGRLAQALVEWDDGQDHR